MQRIVVQLPPPPKSLSKTAVTSASTFDAIVTPRRAAMKKRVTMADAPYLEQGDVNDTDAAVVCADLGRERVMCSSPRHEQFVSSHHTFQLTQQRCERYLAAMGVCVGNGEEHSDALQVETPRAVLAVDRDLGAHLPAPALPLAAGGENHAATACSAVSASQEPCRFTAAKQVLPTGARHRTSRLPSASFACREKRFAVSHPQVPPVGHYSARFHMTERDRHAPTIAPLRDAQQKASERRGTQPPDSARASTDDVAHDSQSSRPQTARERSRARQQRAGTSPREGRRHENTWAFASRVPQLRPPPSTAAAHLSAYDHVNENAIAGVRSTRRCARHITIASQLGRDDRSITRESCAPRGMLCYPALPPPQHLAGMVEFAKQSPRSGIVASGLTESDSIAGSGPGTPRGRSPRRRGEQLDSERGYSTDYAQVDHLDDATRRASPKGAVTFDRQTKRPPLYSRCRLSTAELNDANATERAVRGGHLLKVEFAKQTPRPPALHASPCAVDRYDVEFDAVDCHVPSPFFERYGSHQDAGAFGNIGEWNRDHHQSRELNDNRIDATRPRTVRDVNIAKLAPRKPKRELPEDSDSHAIDVSNVWPKVVQPRVTGDPQMARRVTREHREQMRAPRPPRMPDAPDFYDVPPAVVYNPSLSPKRESHLDFEKMPNRDVIKGGRIVIETLKEPCPHLGPGTYL